MTHKIIEIVKGSAYTGTDVPFSRSIDQIKKMLEKHRLRTNEQLDTGVCSFEVIKA